MILTDHVLYQSGIHNHHDVPLHQEKGLILVLDDRTWHFGPAVAHWTVHATVVIMLKVRSKSTRCNDITLNLSGFRWSLHRVSLLLQRADFQCSKSVPRNSAIVVTEGVVTKNIYCNNPVPH